MSNVTLSTDIYDIASSVEEVKSQYIDEDEDTLAIDIFGYLGSIETRKIQTSIMVASELSNELFAQRAKYKRNLISHAINLNIDDINAVPARIRFHLGLHHDDLVNNLDENNSFIIDRECAFNVAGFEFHPSYDVVLRRSIVKNSSGEREVFTAQYIIDHEDPNANISNPYLAPPINIVKDHEMFVAVSIQFSQMSYNKEYTSIMTNSIIDNKMTTFTFSDQLAYFEVIVNNTDYVTPIFEGSAVPDGVETFCYYTFMDDNTIRVKFDRSSYMPKLNDEIQINVYTTKGKSGNFKYKNGNMISGTIESDKYEYSNVEYILQPSTDSLYGEDQKSKEELRKLIPKEALMKGIVSTTDDLNNYFNMVNTEDILLKAQKKIDNQTERTFYTYFVMKDSDKNVVPTNTLDLYVDLDELSSQTIKDGKRYVLPAGTVLSLDRTKNMLVVAGSGTDDENTNFITLADSDSEEVDDNNSYTVLDSKYGDLNDPNNFIYISPFTIIINKKPLYMQYLLTKINQNPVLDFKFINLNSPLSFISNTIQWYRNFYTNKYNYTLKIALSQNINEDMGVIKTTPMVSDANDIVEAESKDIYNDTMNNRFFIDGEDTDYNQCYGLYWINLNNYNTLNTNITAEFIPQNDSQYMKKLTAENVAQAIVKNINAGIDGFEIGTASYHVYTAIKTTTSSFYPCKIGELRVVMNYTSIIFEGYDSDNEDEFTTSAPVCSKNIITIDYFYRKPDNGENIKVKTVKYTVTISELMHSPKITDFLSSIFNESGYMVIDKDIDVIAPSNASNTSVDSLFFETLTEAVANSVPSSSVGIYYVYTRYKSDILKLGDITVSKSTNNALFYDWNSYDYIIQEDNMNLFQYYMITDKRYDVWNYREDKYVYYSSLKEAVGKLKCQSGKDYYVYIKMTMNGKAIEHPIYLGKIAITFNTIYSGFYIAQVKFVEQNDIYKNSYDDYRDYYYISNSLITSDIEDSYYSTSLFDAILTKKPDTGNWYVYTHNAGNLSPIKMGTISVTVVDSNDYKCTYEWTSQEEYEIESNMKVLALFYRNGVPYRWVNMTPTMSDSNVTAYTYGFETQLTSLEDSPLGNAFDNDGNIYIDETYVPSSESLSKEYGYFNPTTDLYIYVFAKLKDGDTVREYPYNGGLINNYPGVNPSGTFSEEFIRGYTLCNIYAVEGGVNFYENYGNIMNSVVTPVESEDEDGTTAGYKLTAIPVVGYRYSMDEQHITEVVDAMDLRKAYVDNVLDELENTIGIDFKFFNTFGPSKVFTIDQAGSYIDRVNVSLNFRVKLSAYNDEETVDKIKVDVKDYLENLNYIDSEHLSILITQINTDYAEEIDYFDFIGFNEYGPEILHIYKDPDDDMEITTAPELLNVNNKYNEDTLDYEPDINIEVIRAY